MQIQTRHLVSPSVFTLWNKTPNPHSFIGRTSGYVGSIMREGAGPHTAGMITESEAAAGGV